jgi:hypothetical protein
LNKKWLKLLFAFVFFISALSKLIDFHNTVFLFVTTTRLSIGLIKILLLVLIILELFIALFVYLEAYKNKYIYWSILSVIVVCLFSTVLMYGFNFKNCGCMGGIIKISPVHSILKNIGLLIVFIYLGNTGIK